MTKNSGCFFLEVSVFVNAYNSKAAELLLHLELGLLHCFFTLHFYSVLLTENMTTNAFCLVSSNYCSVVNCCDMYIV